jgi:hypothetical protein
MIKVVHGTVRGNTIELDENLGVAEGQYVEIQVTLPTAPAKWGDGLRRCAGALANEWTAEDDRILAEIHESRKHDARREVAP